MCLVLGPVLVFSVPLCWESRYSEVQYRSESPLSSRLSVFGVKRRELHQFKELHKVGRQKHIFIFQGLGWIGSSFQSGPAWLVVPAVGPRNGSSEDISKSTKSKQSVLFVCP